MNINQYKNRFNFAPPEGYIDSLSNKVMNRINQQQQQTKKRNRLIKLIAWSTAAAAVATITLHPITTSQPENNNANSIYEDYTTYQLIENCNTYSLYYYYNNTPNEFSYTSSEFADYAYQLTSDFIIENY